jgi:hypothetical protein
MQRNAPARTMAADSQADGCGEVRLGRGSGGAITGADLLTILGALELSLPLLGPTSPPVAQ